MPFEAKGTTGGIYVGYHRAAGLSRWEIRRREEFIGDTVTVLTGLLADVDAFWMSLTPLANSRFVEVRLDMGKCWWSWGTAEILSVDPLLAWLDGDPRSLLQE